MSSANKGHQASRSSPLPSSSYSPTTALPEPSRDYLQIPSQRSCADMVLEWEIFQKKYPKNALIGILFHPGGGSTSEFSPTQLSDTVVGNTGLYQTNEERIPYLIDIFLQNVHTKNPILDVESLMKHSRKCAERGIGWDGWSCLVLLACALGAAAKPFNPSTTQRATMTPTSVKPRTPSATESSYIHANDLQQAESWFALACRRLGALQHTIVGAQCYFFAGG